LTRSGTRYVLLGLAGLVAGVAALVAAVLEVGPPQLAGAGSVVVVSVLAAALGHRTGGRPWVALLLAVVLGTTAVVVDSAVLRTGASILTVVVGSVYAVMVTVPATSYWRAVREVLLAAVVCAVTSLAAVGFEPTVATPRFHYVSLALALALVFALVYRLGAGFHGLGRRGLVVVLAGGVFIVATLVYTDLLRRYGAGAMVGSIRDVADATENLIGAFPRLIVALLGVPALLWGTFQRARRRQGWWVCAFGVAASAPLAQGLLGAEGSYLEGTLRGVYGIVLGLLVGFVVVRIDLALTAPRGRRGRRAEEAQAHRPEPSRFDELL